MLAVIGMADNRISDIIKPAEIKISCLAKYSAQLRSLDSKLVSFSKEIVAREYNIPLDRIIEVGLDRVSHMPRD